MTRTYQELRMNRRLLIAVTLVVASTTIGVIVVMHGIKPALNRQDTQTTQIEWQDTTILSPESFESFTEADEYEIDKRYQF